MRKNSDRSRAKALSPEPPLSKDLNLPKLLEDFKEGRPISDATFDQIYSPRIRQLSRHHWTPVGVARRAAELLYQGPSTRVLDVGSGVGKFCLVAALSFPGSYVGVEQRIRLVKTASERAESFGLANVSFIASKMESIDWSGYTGIYLFNPFVEHLYDSEKRIDNVVSFGAFQYVRAVHFVQRKLLSLQVGTKIATFHGFGGKFPCSYQEIIREPWEEDQLCVWEKKW